ncbi:MAG: bifunctional heptose 7-phosphate kinase/heptose 1-phosphate adenyltransferase [Candidatus Eiseniibacteriota bacterium]
MIARPVRSPAIARLQRWPGAFAGLPVVVWGDFMLDEYWRCQTRRVSREAPVLVLDFEQRTVQGGGAANAALNLAALGARVTAVGWVGRDAAGRELRGQLKRAGIDVSGLMTHRTSPTVVKTRIVAGDRHTARQQVVRVDRGTPFAASAAERRALLSALDRAAGGARAVVLSDYGYDSVTPVLAQTRVRAWRRRRAIVGLDARYRLAEYRGVTLATPNESEATAAAGFAIDSDRDLARCAQRLRRTLGATHLVITRGRDGLTLWNREAISLAAWGGEEAVDVTGAGDAVVATATLALAAGAPVIEAAALANVAGSVAVSRRGAVPVTAAEVLAALGVSSRAAKRT